MPKISLEAAIDRCAAMTNRFDVGATNPGGEIIIYSGAVPADETVAITTQKDLATFACPNPLFDAPVAGAPGAVAEAFPIAPVAATQADDATFFRVLNRDGDVEMQGSVSDAAGNGELKLDSITTTVGVTVSIVEFKIKEPKA